MAAGALGAVTGMDYYHDIDHSQLREEEIEEAAHPETRKQLAAEFLGTCIVILFGNGVVAATQTDPQPVGDAAWGLLRFLDAGWCVGHSSLY